MRLVVFGFGYSARAVVARLGPRLGAVWGTTRDRGKLAEMEALGVAPLLFDGDLAARDPFSRRETVSPEATDEGVPAVPGWREIPTAGTPSSARFAGTFSPWEKECSPLAQADHVLVSIAPGAFGDPVLARFRNDLAALKPRSLVYLSTVGVYGDHAGAWVDEESECRPVSERSKQRLMAEAGWRLFAEETGVPVAIIRLAGIYGPGRGPFEKVRDGTARRIVKAGQVFNRIHVDDIAAIVEAAFARRADGIFNATDDEPAPPQDVLSYAAELLGVPAPPEGEFETAELTPMARSFYGENKRVRNDKIKRELGVRLAYPTFREGLRAALETERAA